MICQPYCSGIWSSIMTERTSATIDGNEAVARVVYPLNEVVAIYPITPSTPMAEWADTWAAEGKPNLWGTIPRVLEMQDEGGVAGTIHGALQIGALTTTFTASQGLLLMIPNLYKIAGELTPTVFHIAARSLSTQALSIFGDHSDVMATRTTGFAQLCSASVQEAHDFALIAQAATLESRIPFLHFFDGFRTSHEVSTIELLREEDLRSLIDEDLVRAHRARALSPDRPVLRGTAQNPDVYFQSRETVNPYYAACPDIVQTVMDRFAQQAGRVYRLFDYHGAPDAERVAVLMGSGCEAVHETVDYLNAHGEKVGLVKVRLYRPFDGQRFAEALPATVKVIAVLDRTKEPGSMGEPLYLDCVNALYEGIGMGWGNLKTLPKVIGGLYGLSSKEFTPAMIKGIFNHLAGAELKRHFTIGIRDDVSQTSLDYDPTFSIEPDTVTRAIFYVASVAMGARDEHTLKVFLEAEAYEGPSLIIAYSHCIAHGINMSTAMQNQKAAVDSRRWLLYRYHPDRIRQGENPLQLDSRSPKIPIEQSMYLENRFKMLTKSEPAVAKRLLAEAQRAAEDRWHLYQYLAARPMEAL
jgi:pyruvate-ferredoxin/flavodoxin oxidoreductase